MQDFVNGSSVNLGAEVDIAVGPAGRSASQQVQKTTACVRAFAGTFCRCVVGRIGDCGRKDVNAKFKVIYTNDNGSVFTLHKPDWSASKFRMNKHGLHVMACDIGLWTVLDHTIIFHVSFPICFDASTNAIDNCSLIRLPCTQQ